jgi:hypothetical protein
LAELPTEVEWLANLRSKRPRDFARFLGIREPQEYRSVARALVIAWREELKAKGVGGLDSLSLPDRQWDRPSRYWRQIDEKSGYISGLAAAACCRRLSQVLRVL